MNPQLRSFQMFLRQIRKDNMLIAVCIAPILAACFFRFGIPYMERFLCAYFGKETILSDYYLLFDLFLSLITPYLFCFASSMVMLTEYDENMTGYMAVTPVGKTGYLFSRLILPAGLSFMISMFLMLGFTLTDWSFPLILIICLLTCILSTIVTLLLFSFSHNRVEGMAIAKLSGLAMLGLPVPFFTTSSIQYLFCILPSFWIAKFCTDRNLLYLFAALFTSMIWLCLLYKKFLRKLV